MLRKKILSLLMSLVMVIFLLPTATFASASAPEAFKVTKYFGGDLAVEGTDYTYTTDSNGLGCLTLLTDNLTVSMADGVTTTSAYIVSNLSDTSFSYGIHLDGVHIETTNSYAMNPGYGNILFVESDSTLIGQDYGILDMGNFDIYNPSELNEANWTPGSNNSSNITPTTTRTKLTVQGNIDGIRCSVLGVNASSMVLTTGKTGYGINTTAGKVWHNGSKKLILESYGPLGSFKNIDAVSTDTFTIKGGTSAETATKLADGTYRDFSAYKYALITGLEVTDYEGTHTHQIELVEEVPATCTTSGIKAHYQCTDSTCHKLFADEAGTTEVTADSVVLVAGHKWVTSWTNNETHHWHSCENTSCPITTDSEKDTYEEHTPSDWLIDTPAAVGVKGSKHKECIVCQVILETAEIPALSSSSSSSGSGGGIPSIPSTPTLTIPVQSDTNKVDVQATISDSTADVKINNQDLSKILTNETYIGHIEVHLTELNKTIDSAKIPMAPIKAIAEAANNKTNNVTGLLLKFTTANVTFDAKTLNALVEQAKGDDLQIHVDDVHTSRLNTKQKDALKDLEVVAGYEAYVTSNGERISDFKGGYAKVQLSNELAKGKEVQDFSIWYVAEDGSLEKLETRYVDDYLEFAVPHFSDYVVVYNENNKDNEKDETSDILTYSTCPKDTTCPLYSFTDTRPTDWYHDGIHYCMTNGLMVGYSTHLFGTHDAITRGQIAATLWRLEGSPTSNYTMSFEDVPDTAYYAEAIKWAQATGIISGYSSEAFGPNDNLSREQMTSIMWRYAKFKGYDVSIGENTNILSYADALTISEYAIPAMQWSCGIGLIVGSDNQLLPQAPTTRAQVAALLQRFCVNVCGK